MASGAVLASPLPALGADAATKSVPPNPASPSAAAIAGLHTQKSFPLTETRNGITGHIELLEDVRLPELRREKVFPADRADEPCKRPRTPAVSQLCQSLDETALRMSALRLVDAKGEELAAREFLWGATLESLHRYGDTRVSYIVNVDESAGFGSYLALLVRGRSLALLSAGSTGVLGDGESVS